LVECGPGSTTKKLEHELNILGYSVKDISDVFLTHIHLDHAGAAGWFARHGARIHVHPVGAPHLIDPGKLLSSAERIYGDQLEFLWGEFLPVPEDHLSILADSQVVQFANHQIRPLETPGHARHHYVYVFEDTCFSGDIAGVRLSGFDYVGLPTPPPEFHLEDWFQSHQKLQKAYDKGIFNQIAPTHFGIFKNADLHLNNLADTLHKVEVWIENFMPSIQDFDQLSRAYSDWINTYYEAAELDAMQIQSYEIVNPSWMSIRGIERYWKKYRIPK